MYPAALRYLARRDYAEQELRDKLLARGATEAAVDDCVERLYAAGYLDQQRFAQARTRQRRDFSARGRLAVRLELRGLGLDEEGIQAALDAEYDEEQERQILTQLISRGLSRLPGDAGPEQRRHYLAKLQRQLLSRGFQAALVYELLRQAGDSEF